MYNETKTRNDGNGEDVTTITMLMMYTLALSPVILTYGNTYAWHDIHKPDSSDTNR
jgi:hypothetical protein